MEHFLLVGSDTVSNREAFGSACPVLHGSVVGWRWDLFSNLNPRAMKPECGNYFHAEVQ